MKCIKRKLKKPYVNGPRTTEIHGSNHYAQLPYLGPTNRATEQGIARLADALEWLSYIYKARDKHEGDWGKEGQIFPASRPTRCKQIAIPADMRSQAEHIVRINTGDSLLDQLIAMTQYRYGQPVAALSATHH